VSGARGVGRTGEGRVSLGEGRWRSLLKIPPSAVQGAATGTPALRGRTKKGEKAANLQKAEGPRRRRIGEEEEGREGRTGETEEGGGSSKKLSRTHHRPTTKRLAQEESG